VLSDKNWAHQVAPLKRVALIGTSAKSGALYRRLSKVLYSRFSAPVELPTGKMPESQVILFLGKIRKARHGAARSFLANAGCDCYFR
jgi:hypothetical protein